MNKSGVLNNYRLRLVGCPPFWHRRQVVMLRSIMEGKYHFHSPEWDDISLAAKDLVGTDLHRYKTCIAIL